MTTSGEEAPCKTRSQATPSTVVPLSYRHDLAAVHLVDGHLGLLSVGELDESTAFALTLLVSENCNLLHNSVRLKHDPHVLLCACLAQHSNKHLTQLWRTKEQREGSYSFLSLSPDLASDPAGFT